MGKQTHKQRQQQHGQSRMATELQQMAYAILAKKRYPPQPSGNVMGKYKCTKRGNNYEKQHCFTGGQSQQFQIKIVEQKIKKPYISDMSLKTGNITVECNSMEEAYSLAKEFVGEYKKYCEKYCKNP